MNWAKVKNSRFQIFFFFFSQKNGGKGKNVTKNYQIGFFEAKKSKKIGVAILLLDEQSQG